VELVIFIQVRFLKLKWLLIECHFNTDRIKVGHDLVEVLQDDFLCCCCGQTSLIFVILKTMIKDIYTYCIELLVLQLFYHYSTVAAISVPLLGFCTHTVTFLGVWADCRSLGLLHDYYPLYHTPIFLPNAILKLTSAYMTVMSN
jgi:hypothetical protein